MCAKCSSLDVSSHFCMWFLLCRCCKWFCCFCSHVYPHKYNSIVITIPIVYGFFLSIVITIPIVDGFFFYFITSKFPSYFSQIRVDLNIQSINSIVLVTRLSSVFDHYLFSIVSPASSAGLYLPSPGSYFSEFHRQSHGQYQASPLGRKQ